MLSQNIINVRDAIETICKQNNQDAKSIKIVAATKMVPSDIIKTLPSYGIVSAGENKVQELLDKYDDKINIDWQFIGSLQTNKVKYIIDKVSLIHSVDRMSLAEEISKQAKKINKTMEVLIEVNIGKEPNKSGVFEDNLFSLCDCISSLDNIKLVGLMSVMPKICEELLYEKMHNLYRKMQGDYKNIKYLSMGMSGDYLFAVKYGSNMVRLGSVLFGARV